MGESIGIVNRAGAWYSYGGDVRLGQGRENSKTFLRENPDIAEEIEARIRDELGMTVPDSDTAEAAAGAGGEEGAEKSAKKEASKNSRPPSKQAPRR